MADNFEGGQLATEHLLAQGHQRIGYIFGERHHPQSVRQRYLGYVDQLKSNSRLFEQNLMILRHFCHQLLVIFKRIS